MHDTVPADDPHRKRCLSTLCALDASDPYPQLPTALPYPLAWTIRRPTDPMSGSSTTITRLHAMPNGNF